MRSILLVLVLLAASSAVSFAGPNANGAIIVHTSDTYSFSTGTACSTALGQPATCEAAITRSDRCDAGGGSDDITTIWFLAALPPNSSPSVAGIYFGTEVDEGSLDADTRFGICGPPGSLQDVSAGWPYDGGATVGFGTPVAGEVLFRFYYFGVMNLDCDSGQPNPHWCSAVNGLAGYAAFFDGSYPPLQDNVTRFGCVRWYEEGQNDCPETYPLGVCCNSITGACVMTIEEGCSVPGIWHPEWSACSPNPCPQVETAACCDDLTGACTLVQPGECAYPGIWHPEWTSCSPNPCPQPVLGACCDYFTGACAITTHLGCDSPGVWHPEWTTCLPNPCPQSPPEQAACCWPDGFCYLAHEEDCFEEWHPEWTSCSPNPCPVPPSGACCNLITGACSIRIEYYCHGSDLEWHPDWLSCSPNPCPPGQPRGVCCDEYYGRCTITWEAYCDEPSTWHPDWSSCEPNPCPVPPPFPAACCSMNGSCTLALESECPWPSVWHPEWTTCMPNYCPPPVPTERTTWGKVKALYR